MSKSAMLLIARLGASPLRARGSAEPIATALNAVLWGSGLDFRHRLSQPLAVLFTPGVPDSM